MSQHLNSLTFIEKGSDNPQYLAVLMHGYGADNFNMMPIAHNLSESLPNLHFILPNAPFPFEGDMVGRQWFSLVDRSEKAMLKGANEAEEILLPFLKAQLSRFALSYNKLILMGFSQGAMMAIHVGLRLPETAFAIVGYCGNIISWHNGIIPALQKVNTSSRTSQLTAPHIFLAHGELDDVIPVAASKTAHRKFLDSGLNSHLYLDPFIGHSISNIALAETTSFLSKILK